MMIGIFRDGVLEMLVTESLDRKLKGYFAIPWTCFLPSFRVELCREYWWTSSQVHVNGISQNQYILFPIHQTSDRWLLPQDARDSAEEKTFLDHKTDPSIQIDLFKLLSSLSLSLSVGLNTVTSDPHLLLNSMDSYSLKKMTSKVKICLTHGLLERNESCLPQSKTFVC